MSQLDKIRRLVAKYPDVEGDSLHDLLKLAAGEIERLQAIVALLPTNANGAVLFRGSVVYWREDEKVQRGIFQEMGTVRACVARQPEGQSCYPLIEWLHSTPEAAEASA